MNIERTRALVTGGSGFIGGHLCEALTQKGVVTLVVDVRPPEHLGNEVQFMELDLLDAAGVRRAIEEFKPDVIYNLAAHANISDGQESMFVNVQGCQNIIDAVDSLDKQPLIVQVSTQLVVEAGYAAKSDTDFSPYTEYGESKAAAEKLFHKLPEKFRWTIMRPTNVWGPRHPTFAAAIWKYIKWRVYIHPVDCDPLRSYGYVENVVHQMTRALDVPPEKIEGRTFYLGEAPIPSSVWLNAFSLALTNKPVRRARPGFLRALAWAGELSGRLGGPSPINRGRLYRMTTDYPVPMAATFEVLGHGPVSLEDGVKRTVNWLNGRQ